MIQRKIDNWSLVDFHGKGKYLGLTALGGLGLYWAF